MAKTCFVICPLGEPGTDIRREADQLLRYILHPVLDKLGYQVIRADTVAEPGRITTQIVDMLVESDLVVADLSYRNPNVFYELAIRHATRKPFVQLIGNRWRIPFDIADQRTIVYDIHDLDDVEQAKQRLEDYVQAATDNPDECRSLLSEAILLKSIREHPPGEGMQAVMDIVTQQLERMRGDLADIRRRLARAEADAAAPRILSFGPSLQADYTGGAAIPSASVPTWAHDLVEGAVSGLGTVTTLSPHKAPDRQEES